MSGTIPTVIEADRRQIFLEDVNHSLAKLRDDETAWAQEQAERREWDATLSDGLKDGM